jgi:cell division protein FtsQ
MARNSPTISQEGLYPPDEGFAREEIADTRLLDLGGEEESPFLRGQKRVSARRSSLSQQAAIGLKWTLLTVTVIVLGSISVGAIYHYGEHSWRFRVESSDDIEITGSHNVTHAQIMEVMGGDIGRNIFFIPLAQRKAQLEQIPWVESASIMRFVPNRLKIEIHERTPVAFARLGPRIWLVDAGGTLMELPSNTKKKFSFPVILGMNAGEPPSTRSARMKIYNELVRELDSAGAHYSQELSEVDLSDPDDVKVSVENPSGEVLVHLGSSSYLDRYKVFATHLQEWRQQFDKLQSVDLRYDRQIVVNPDLRGATKQTPLSAGAAKAAISAGVKPTALIKHDSSPSTRRVGTPPTKSWTRPAGKSAGNRNPQSRWTKHRNRYVARNSAQASTTTGQKNSRPAASRATPGDSRTNAKPASITPRLGPKVTQRSISKTANGIAKPETAVPEGSTSKKPSPGVPGDRDHP